MIGIRVDGVRGDGKPLVLEDISWEEAMRITTLHPRWRIVIGPEPQAMRLDSEWDEEPQ